MANDAVAGNVLRSARVRPSAGMPPRPARDHPNAAGEYAYPAGEATPSTGDRPAFPGAPVESGPDPAEGRPEPPTRAVEHTLAAFLARELDTLAGIDPALDGFGRIARDCVLAGGKRLRPTFAYWGWRGVVGGREPVAPVLPALAALELLHTFALVHDDVMDSSAARRGRPTAHRVMADGHVAAGRTGSPERFGEAAAVLVGDLCLIWADGLLSQAMLPPETLLAARHRYDRMRVETVAGQYLDVLGETDARNWSVDRALRVARYKTASYTVRGPLLFGAALADRRGDAPPTGVYSRYGRAVGEAFQLRDDLLGVYGDFRTTGKPAGDDLRSGKPTTLLMLARQLADPRQRAVLDRGLDRAVAATGLDRAVSPTGGLDRAVAATGLDRGVSPAGLDRAVSPAGGLDDRAVAELADVVAATGAVHRVEEMIAERVSEALDALDSAPIDATARRALTELAVTATARQA